MMNDAKRRLQALIEIVTPYPNGPAEVSSEEMLRFYIKAVDGYDVDLVEDAASMFTRGQAPGHDGRFRPSPALVAKTCWVAAEKRARDRYLQKIANPQLPPPPFEKTAESRARVQQMAADYALLHPEPSRRCGRR